MSPGKIFAVATSNKAAMTESNHWNNSYTQSTYKSNNIWEYNSIRNPISCEFQLSIILSLMLDAVKDILLF